ncbi:MAG: YceI family protein [Saprospiraceae bacterium]
MKKINFLGMIAAIVFLSAFTVSNSMNWQIADGYSIKFSSKDPSGVFNKLTGDIQFDEANLDASIFDVQIDVASINTGNGMQNRHAKGKKWFNAKKYPTINFTSKKFSKSPTGYEVMGILEMHGVKKEFTMPFTFINNVFETSFTVNRLDFNIGSTKGMSKKVPLDIQLDISVPVSK